MAPGPRPSAWSPGPPLLLSQGLDSFEYSVCWLQCCRDYQIISSAYLCPKISHLKTRFLLSHISVLQQVVPLLLLAEKLVRRVAANCQLSAVLCLAPQPPFSLQPTALLLSPVPVSHFVLRLLGFVSI